MITAWAGSSSYPTQRPDSSAGGRDARAPALIASVQLTVVGAAGRAAGFEARAASDDFALGAAFAVFLAGALSALTTFFGLFALARAVAERFFDAADDVLTAFFFVAFAILASTLGTK